MRKRFYIFIALFCISVGVFAQEHKNALLIANNIYETSEKEQKLRNAQNQNLDENVLLFPDLKTPIKEAHDLRDVLVELGFNVTLLENADKKQIRNELRNFQSKTKSEKGIAFFHYGGHAVQVDGDNYLIPAKSDVVPNSEISDEAVKVDSITESMRGENNIVVLDACRSIPYKSTGTRGGGGEYRGLAAVRARPDFIIIHSASSGESAVDGIFTPIFTKHIKEKNELSKILKEVRAEVRQQTKGNQNPEDRSQLTSDIFLAGRDIKGLGISGTTGKLEISVISPCNIFLDGAEIAEMKAFETKILDVPTGGLKIVAKYSDGHDATYQRIVKTNETESLEFQYTMKSESDKCYEIAANYYCGQNGSKKDYNKAFEYYKIAANAGHSAAQNMLGICYEKGKGTSKNESEAFAWYKKAASNRNSVAMRNVGICYEFGTGTSVDYKEAKWWYEQAVSNGYSKAKDDLKNLNDKIENERVIAKKSSEPKYERVYVGEEWGLGKFFLFWYGGVAPVGVGALLMVCFDGEEDGGLVTAGAVCAGVGGCFMLGSLFIDNEPVYETRRVSSSDNGDFFQNFRVALAPNAVALKYKIAL